jgi:hypothetical protein
MTRLPSSSERGLLSLLVPDERRRQGPRRVLQPGGSERVRPAAFSPRFVLLGAVARVAFSRVSFEPRHDNTRRDNDGIFEVVWVLGARRSPARRRQRGDVAAVVSAKESHDVLARGSKGPSRACSGGLNATNGIRFTQIERQHLKGTIYEGQDRPSPRR